MTLVTRLLILTSLLILVSCTHYRPPFIQNRHKEYLTATSIPPLKIPPGISSDAFKTYYPVPYRSYPPSTYTVNTLPPGL